MAGRSHVNANEERPSWSLKDPKATPYELSKMQAERLVLDTNSPTFLSVALRIYLAYGERDTQMVPNQLPAVYKKQTNIELGNNTSLYDFVYAGNVAKAHILAAKALLNPDCASGNVDGEAFILTNGKPMRFWDTLRLIWRAAGDTTRPEDIIVMPGWLAMAMAIVTEWVLWIVTLVRRRPLIFNKQVMSHVLWTQTFNIDKARERLGYDPVANLEDCIKRSVEWEIEKRKSEEKSA